MVQTLNLRRTTALALVVLLVASATLPSPAAAQGDEAPAFIVELNADGSAEVIVRSTFDLTTDSEQEAFQTLMDDEEARQTAADRFRDRMQAVASDAQNATGREMDVTGSSIDLRRTADGDVGIVTLSVTWDGLAVVDGDTLAVTEPFASGFTPDRPFVLVAPDGYEIASVTPEVDARTTESATWDDDTDLSGFSAELQPTEDDVTQTEGQPGFGVLVALLAVLVTAGLFARRRERH
jgi:PGF-CTERM protein